MSRRGTVRFLVLYLAVVWLAVVIRVDRFPLTWAPMYSTFVPSDPIRVRLVDDARMKKGLRVTRANGSQDFVDQHDLNMPRWNFWRLYGRRMDREGPANHAEGNTKLSSFNRWWRGLEEGELNFEVDWARRILRSVNHTLGHAPGDPDFIVRAEVLHHVLSFDQHTLEIVGDETLPRVVEWDDSYADGWGDGSL